MLSNLFKQMLIFPQKTIFRNRVWKIKTCVQFCYVPKAKKEEKYIYAEWKTDFQITISLDHCLVALANDEYS